MAGNGEDDKDDEYDEETHERILDKVQRDIDRLKHTGKNGGKKPNGKNSK